MASIGVMSYSPHQKTHAGVVNALYCAPNKIFEYGKYGKPMIANDVPALKYILKSIIVERLLTTQLLQMRFLLF